ncbi:hypothetical protein [Hellea balneolensis]|uniref:hypothetical protein n=1 Tax=Hellea balneolensis TaxID=287478 RepID=UPI00040D6131|nr:hypothetical protein [Hellea balneolensis]
MKISNVIVLISLCFLFSGCEQKTSKEIDDKARVNESFNSAKQLEPPQKNDVIYIELSNENELILNEKIYNIPKIKTFLKENKDDLPIEKAIIHVSESSFEDLAYKLASDLELITGKRVWVVSTY